MQATSLAIRFVLSLSCAMLAAPAVSEDIGLGPPPALAPGQAPALPQAGPLAEPRSSDQVGFPSALTQYVISPTTLRPARVALGQRLFFEPRLSGDRTVACATCHDPARAFTDGRPVSVGIHGRVGQRNAPTILNALYSLTIKVPAAYFSADPERISRALKWRAAPVGSAADSCAKDAGSVPEL
jgi:cytochrome c peroxidase